MNEQRYYYKTEDGKGLLNLKSPVHDANYIAITEEEFNLLSEGPAPTAEQLAKQAKREEMSKILSWLNANDYIINKHILGEYTDNDPKWIAYLADRAIKLARYNQLESEL